MKILQLDVDNIKYELIKPEASVYEQSDEKSVSVDDAVALLVSVEMGDDDSVAEKAVNETLDFMSKNKRQRLVIYPFAHLSNNLLEPKEAMRLIAHMQEIASSKVDSKKAPFGWNKGLTLVIKGHPLAEMSRSYGDAEVKKEARTAVPHRKIDTSIVRKSDFSGLPETDHRTIAEKLDLFSFQEVSPGMVYWHRNGLVVYRELVGLVREMLRKYEYQEVSTPSLANVALWHVSGHIDHYRDNMFMFGSESEQLGMKPMNCPSTILIFKSRKWSYRELPFRTAIFDRLYRNEISGALTGLFRVREFSQDDGHIFIAEEQLAGELTKVLALVSEVYKTFGMTFKAKLSTMPDDHMGDEMLWEKATTALIEALKANNLSYVTKEKEGAFYGPKIDFDVFDSMGRDWQCATIQIDYQLPIRFKLEYTGEDGKQHTPVMIHRAILGSLERFLGVLIEHYQGKFPVWLSPQQVKVISISEQANSYAESVYAKLKDSMLRVELDSGDRTLEYKIRDAQMQKIPYMIVVGKKESDSGMITIRDRSGKQKRDVKLEDFVGMVKGQIESRSDSLLQ
jgi:threonyl-tRNA synthetase